MFGWINRWHDRIFVPVPDAEEYQLIVAWHGYGQRPRLFRLGSQIDQIARWFTEAGIPTIAYYPAGEWRNWGRRPLKPLREPHESVPLMDDKINRILKRYPIGRILYVGFSKGAIFAGFYARYGPWDPEAVVIYAGAHTGKRPARCEYPVLLIRGTKDRWVEREWLTKAQQWYWTQGHLVQVIEPPGGGHEWDAHLNPQVFGFLNCAKCPQLGNVSAAIAELRAAGLDSWDDIEDPEKYIQELRG